MTIFTRTSTISGRVNQMEIPDITESDVRAWAESSAMIQDYFPQLTPVQREFLLSGATQEEWNMLDEDYAGQEGCDCQWHAAKIWIIRATILGIVGGSLAAIVCAWLSS